MRDARRRRSAVPPPLAVPLVLALAFGCRDTPELFDAPELEPLGPPPFQLTYDVGRDLSPTWSASGDSVIYVTEELRVTDGGTFRIGRPLRVIAREGGVATKVFPNLQPSDHETVALDFAVQSSDGRVAAFTLLPLLDPQLCGETIATCDPPVDSATAADPLPRLNHGLIRLREPAASNGPNGDVQRSVDFPGRTFDTSEHPQGLDGLWRVDVYPFQRWFKMTGRIPDRISWSPDGAELVFSDGTALQIWNPDTGETTPIPGTEDGVNPAWSPNRRWIAFERFERGPLAETTCTHRAATESPDPGPVVCVEQHRSWPLVSHALALIHPDGSGLRLLPDGTRPAWAGDGGRVYYEVQGRIWSVALDGTDARPVPNTENGFMPAPSPDGTQLAFARSDPGSTRSDIWIVSLEP